jgi:hypothetical protein
VIVSGVSSITVTTPEWTQVPLLVTMDALRSNRILWRRMHLGDWDRVPEHARERALDVMLVGYRAVLSPAAWPDMTVTDWDLVPQPMRAVAYLRMIRHWVANRQVGTEFGLRTSQVAQAVAAIVMAESWFEHRAVNENPYGNRDLGLAQCSDPCRARLASMAAAGEISDAPLEEDYLDPRVGTWVATVWFERELRNAGGDVPRAIRAYHRGLPAAMDEKGDAYLEKVERLRDDYIRTQRASPAWDHLIRRVAMR